MLEKSLMQFLVLIFVIKTTIASCMSSRANSDSDCYLNHLARENVIRMGMEGGCDAPKQQVVYPEDEAKIYMPRGTLLYRCNDMSGCCPQKEHSCQPISDEELRVAFYAIDCGTSDMRPTPEYVMMKNHTKCGCRPRMEGNQGMDSSVNSVGMTSPQRLMDTVCGQGRQQSIGHRQQMPSYQPYGQSSYGQSSYNLQGSSYGQSPQMSYNNNRMSQSMPCSKSSQSTRPLIDGMVVRGTIQLTVAPKAQQPCPYG